MNDSKPSRRSRFSPTIPPPVLDTRGLVCPEPVMMLHGQIRGMSAGDEVTVLATDPSTQRDIARFCEFLGHALLASEERDGEFLFRIRKGG